VLKRSRGPVYATWLGQEYAALRALSATDLPIPRALGFLEREVDGEPEAWLVMTRVPGQRLSTRLTSIEQPSLRATWFHRVGEMLARIHATVLPDALHDRRATPWLDRVRDRASSKYESKAWPPKSRAILEELDSEPTVHVPHMLIHGDFTLDNVLVDEEHITGVLDWGGCGRGDPRYDIALALATDPKLQLTAEEVAAFFEGYGSGPLPHSLRDYLEHLAP
jgi:aminoglycoside phosphotransferase (APT) family kinase protein